MNGADPPAVLYSIGHSNHTLERFLELLQLHGIQAVADVRSSPYSRYSPQFSKDSLEHELKSHNIAYVFLGPELGARRDEPECYRNGRVVYEEIAKTEAFQRGIARLTEGAARMRIAMMCAEQDPLTCHRTILIARHLAGLLEVIHILPDGSVETQAQAEQRLLVESGLHEEDLFVTRAERVEDAYLRRETDIAYEEPVVHD
jgi:uncharacterized protein (DUF488 family)